MGNMVMFQKHNMIRAKITRPIRTKKGYISVILLSGVTSLLRREVTNFGIKFIVCASAMVPKPESNELIKIRSEED